MKIREIMTKKVETIAPEQFVFDVAQIMKNKNIGSVPVVDNNQALVGIVTDRDIVLRVVCEGRDAKMTKIQDMMSTDVIVASSEDDVHEAAKVMAQQQIRRLPIVDNDKLSGIVAIGDLAVQDIFVNEAGDALHTISKPSQPVM